MGHIQLRSYHKEKYYHWRKLTTRRPPPLQGGRWSHDERFLGENLSIFEGLVSCMLKRLYAWKFWHFLMLNVVNLGATVRFDVSDLRIFLPRLWMTETRLQLCSWRYVIILEYFWVNIMAFCCYKTRVHDFEETSTKSTGRYIYIYTVLSNLNFHW